MKKSVLFYLLFLPLCADIKSTNGVIQFDIESDSTPEMTLNTSGLGIGTTIGKSTLEINGSLGFGVELVDSDITLSNNTIILVDSASDNITLTLPAASTVTGRTYLIKKKSNLNQVWINANETIDGQDSRIEMTGQVNLKPYVQLISDGTQWLILNGTPDLLSVVAADNLVGWWKLDETSGAVALDSSPEKHHGTLMNMTLSTDSVTGQINRAFEFDGTTEYVEASNLPVGKAFTVMAWAKSNTATWNNHGFIVSSRSANGFILHPNSGTNDVRLIIYSSTSTQTSLSNFTPVDIQIWHHYAASYDADTLAWAEYLDGVIKASGTTSITRTASTATVNLGKDHNVPGRYFDGQIDDARIYNKALTAAEITLIYEQAE